MGLASHGLVLPAPLISPLPLLSPSPHLQPPHSLVIMGNCGTARWVLCRGVLEAGKAWGGQEDYLQCRGAHLQPMHCCLKGLTPPLLPVNGILEGLEGKEGMEGWLERIPTTQGIQHE